MELAAIAGIGVLIGVTAAIIIALLNRRPREKGVESSEFKTESLQRILDRHERDHIDQ